MSGKAKEKEKRPKISDKISKTIDLGFL